MTIEMLYEEMVKSWKRGDKFTKTVLSNIIAQIKKAAIDAGCRDNISENFVNAQLLKAKKNVQEQIDTCPVDRIMLLKQYNTEMEIINKYAPKIVNSEDEIRKAIAVIVGDGSIKRGKVMKAIKESSTAYDMATVNKILTAMIGERR